MTFVINKSKCVSKFIWLATIFNVTVISVVGGYDAYPVSERPGFDPPLRHRMFLDQVTYLTHCYIWWPMSSLSSKCMRTCFLLGGVNVIVISVLGGLAVMMLSKIARV